MTNSTQRTDLHASTSSMAAPEYNKFGSYRLNAIKKKYSVEQVMSSERVDSNQSSPTRKGGVSSALGVRDSSRSM